MSGGFLCKFELVKSLRFVIFQFLEKYLFVKPKASIKVFTFKSENVVFAKFTKKILMTRHNKIYKMIEFLTIFIISFYFEELYSGTT